MLEPDGTKPMGYEMRREQTINTEIRWQSIEELPNGDVRTYFERDEDVSSVKCYEPRRLRVFEDAKRSRSRRRTYER